MTETEERLECSVLKGGSPEPLMWQSEGAAAGRPLPRGVGVCSQRGAPVGRAGQGATLGRGSLREPLAAGREILKICLSVPVSPHISVLQMGSDSSSEAVTSCGSGPFPSRCKNASGVSSAWLPPQWVPKQLLQSAVSTGFSILGGE